MIVALMGDVLCLGCLFWVWVGFCFDLILLWSLLFWGLWVFRCFCLGLNRCFAFGDFAGFEFCLILVYASGLRYVVSG